MPKFDTPSSGLSHSQVIIGGSTLTIKRVKEMTEEALASGNKVQVSTLKGQFERVAQKYSVGFPTLIKTIQSQVRLLGKWQTEGSQTMITGLHLKQRMSKAAFLKALDTIFVYNGKAQTLREALISTIFQKDIHWINTVCSILKVYNDQFPSILGLPISLDGLSRCLQQWDKNHTVGSKKSRIGKQEFIDICALDPEGKHRVVSLREKFLLALDTPCESGSTITLRDAIQDTMKMQQKYIHWFSTVTPVFVRYNSSVLTSTETLPIYFQTFGIQIFGKVSLKKSEFCSLCGNDIVLDIPSKEEKIGIPKKSKPKRTQNPTQKERKRNPPRVLPDTTGKGNISLEKNGETEALSSFQIPPKSVSRDHDFHPTDEMFEFGGEWYWKHSQERVKGQ